MVMDLDAGGIDGSKCGGNTVVLVFSEEMETKQYIYIYI
jgi:hypothetical protein